MRVTTVNDTPQLRARWSALAEASGNIFITPEWIDSWWVHLGAGLESDLFVVEDGGEIVAVAPLARGPLGPTVVARFAGYGPADAMGPACSPERARGVLQALAEADLGAPVFLAERLPADLAVLPGFVAFGSETSPIVELNGDWEAYFASRSSKLRAQVRRKQRKLEREHGLVLRCADATTLESDLDLFFRLHDDRWEEGGSGAFDGERGAFHREFARRALSRGWLRLWVAEVEGGQGVAVWYGFRFGGEEWYYQAGRDREWDRHSVGVILVAHTMQLAAEDGVAVYRLLRGNESYKERFLTGDEPVVTVATARSGAGRVGLRIAQRVGRSELARRGVMRLADQRPFRDLPGSRPLLSVLRGA